MQYKVYSGTNLVDVIGSGRNYLLDSASYPSPALPTKPTDNINVNKDMQLSVDPTYFNGKQIIVSVMVDIDTVTAVGTGKVRTGWEMSLKQADGSTGYAGGWLLPTSADIGKSFHKRVYTVFSPTQYESLITARSYIQGFTAKSITVSKPMVVLGNVLTDWSPAPEDLGLDPTQTNLHGYQLTGLTPATSYTMSVVANNGLRDSSKASVTFTTADTVVIPKALTVGSTVSLSYVEYALGLVPIGNEPSGDFGGTKAKILTGKVASVSGSNSTIEFSGVTFAAGKAMTLNAGGVYMAVDGYKSIYYKP